MNLAETSSPVFGIRGVQKSRKQTSAERSIRNGFSPYGFNGVAK